jgi:hypothetical protein
VPSSYTLKCARARRGKHDAHRNLTTHAAKALTRRLTIPIELPEFAIRALEHRVEMTNAGAHDEEMVSFNDVVEWYLFSPLSVKEIPHLEFAVPGFTAALMRWMMDATYSGPE